jgi:hypothetical protein
LLRRDRGDTSIEGEREALRRQRVALAEELERLKTELAARVAAVREKERQLDEALGRAGASATAPHPDVAGGREVSRAEGQLAERERALAERERALAAREAAPAADPSADQLARIEKRLRDLKEAERVFLRTQEELAARSEAVAARERLVADREREIDALEDAAGLGPTRSELTELENRLRRLESRPAPSTLEDTQSFAGGLEALRRRGTRRPPGH